MLNSLFTNYKVHLFLFVLTMISYLPFDITSLMIKPDIILMSIFFFSILEDTRPSHVFLIFLGLIDDLISGSLTGITSLEYILIAVFASTNKKALWEQKFQLVWMALAATVVAVVVLKTIILSIYNHANLFSIALVFEILISILCYPALHLLFYKKKKWFKVTAHA